MAKLDSLPVSLKAAADLSAKLYRFGKMTSTGINLCTNPGERADLVIGGPINLQNVGLDSAYDGYIERIFKIEVGSAGATKGDALTNDSVGRAATATAGQSINGIALESGTVGAYIEMLRPLSGGVPQGYGGFATVKSGALTPGLAIVYLSVTGTQAYTLADGTAVGQVMDIICTVAASTPLGTLTIADPFAGESAVYVFHAVGQRIKLGWDGTGWKPISKVRAGTLTVVVGTTVLTGFLLTETYSLSVTGTVHSTGTKGIPAPQLAGEYIRVIVGTAATIPLGDIAIAGFTAALVAATSLSNITLTTNAATFLSNGASWDAMTITSATYS